MIGSVPPKVREPMADEAALPTIASARESPCCHTVVSVRASVTQAAVPAASLRPDVHGSVPLADPTGIVSTVAVAGGAGLDITLPPARPVRPPLHVDSIKSSLVRSVMD